MFKPTPSLQKTLRRLPLSPKQAGKEYYKGNRVGSLGTITRFGNFRPDWSKIRTYVVPETGKGASMMLSPFVDAGVEKVEELSVGTYKNYDKRFTGEDYLREWKLAGGYDHVYVAEGDQAGEAGMNETAPFEERAAVKKN
ncbi:hypothetical protein BDW02DRAFT_571233 [Decorospora gaudefroyi]|uniref:50S ribosomal protein-like protein YmL27 n=1 Tax=Decorospora gaudefroyi TaxID=184978 RepID=A0A6A5K6S6_9PLEO|nr:hypothetical protein BDW02DRAFT_571233 [Decorospora gaudefroyi]